jgi:hypothetical protein
VQISIATSGRDLRQDRKYFASNARPFGSASRHSLRTESGISFSMFEAASFATTAQAKATQLPVSTKIHIRLLQRRYDRTDSGRELTPSLLREIEALLSLRSTGPCSAFSNASSISGSSDTPYCFTPAIILSSNSNKHVYRNSPGSSPLPAELGETESDAFSLVIGVGEWTAENALHAIDDGGCHLATLTVTAASCARGMMLSFCVYGR